MAYATQADIEARYPGEPAQAGPRDANNQLDAAAIALACYWASIRVDHVLRVIGWETPVAAPAPAWLTDLTVDLALYQATPTALASQADFSDRRARYQAALDHLDAIAQGQLRPAPPDSTTSVTTVYLTSNTRLFGRETE